jgi:hypothetical protein
MKNLSDWKQQYLTSRLAADFTGWEPNNAKFESQFERVARPEVPYLAIGAAPKARCRT